MNLGRLHDQLSLFLRRLRAKREARTRRAARRQTEPRTQAGITVVFHLKYFSDNGKNMEERKSNHIEVS